MEDLLTNEEQQQKLVELSEGEIQQPFYLLTPGNYPPRTGPTFGQICDPSDLAAVLQDIAASRIVALDFETKGNDYSDELDIVGIGLAFDAGCVYFEWNALDSNQRTTIANALGNHPGLIAHNIYFDGGVWKKEFGEHASWFLCTYAALAMTANEGYPGIGWGLKWAMTALLGWTDSNEHDLDDWLVHNGWYTGVRLKEDTPENRFLKREAGKLRPDKGEMWRAPTEILGKYCCLDAEATYLLYTEVLEPVLEKFPALREFLTGPFHRHILRHIDQKFLGIPVDREGLLARREVLQTEIAEVTSQFLSHPEVRAEILQLETEWVLNDFVDKEPPKYRQKKPAPKPPEMYKANGEISKSYTNWIAKYAEWEKAEPVVSLNWVNWEARYSAALRGENPDYRFNINSGDQLRELFFNKKGYEIRGYTEPSTRFPQGQPEIGVDVLKFMGEAGKLLVRNSELAKDLSYVVKYLELTEHRATIHPSFRTPGTNTQRLSSNNPNLQQVPKTMKMMSLFRARPGKVWVDIDFAALESVVAAELSGDPNLHELYADGKPENDIHLFVAASVPGEMGRAILETGYRPNNPPAGTVGKAKKECKAQRSIAKTVVYACQFGAGVDKVVETLESDGIYLPYHQVETIHSTYWNTFARLKQYSYELQREWKRNNGYVMNGFGRPMPTAEHLKKDCLSRVIQSTGHDILVYYVDILDELLTEAGIPLDYVIRDWHDATTIEVDEHLADRVIEIMQDAMRVLNGFLGGQIQHRGKPVVGVNLADCKEPEQ